MPDNREVRQPGQSTTQASQQETARQIQEQLEQEVRETANNLLERRLLEKGLVDAIKDAEVSAGEQRRSTHLRSQGTPHEISLNERQALKKSLVRVLKGVEQGIVSVPSESNKALLLQLNDKIGSQMSEDNVAFLQPLVSSLLENNQSVADLQSQFNTLRQEWGIFSPELVKKVSEALVQTADEGRLAVNGEQAREMFEVNEEQGDVMAHSPEYGQDFSHFWEGSGLQEFYEEADKKIIYSLSSVDRFADHIDELKKAARADGEQSGLQQLSASATDQEREEYESGLWRKVSLDFEQEVVICFSKLYKKVHTVNAGQFFEEIAQENFMRSIKTASETLTRMLERLAEETNNSAVRARFGDRLNMPLVMRNSIQQLETKHIKTGRKDPITGEDVLSQVQQYKTIPVPGMRPVTIEEYIIGVRNQALQTIETESYSHNVQALFLRGASKEGGFWAQLAGYAEQKMSSVDMDNLNNLPDSECFISAYQLYSKYLQGEFAMLSWRHQPSMFEKDFLEKYSLLQQKVRNDLKKLFPDLIQGQSDWRLQRAMNIGLGLSRGVFLSEPDLAAWADPAHQGEGEAAYQSYYLNDNAALTALNPQHHFDRWRTMSANRGPLMHIPVAGIPRKYMRRWNHRILWEEMQKRQESYLKGDYAYTDEKGEKNRMLSLIDYLPNIGKVGSHLDRRGWRYFSAFDAWMVKDGAGKPQIFESWKALENIGYEAVKWFGESQNLEKGGTVKLAETVIEGKTDSEIKKIENARAIKRLYEDLHDRYINSPSVDSEGRLKERTSLDKTTEFDRYFAKECSGEDNPEATFMARVYTHLLRQRIPTKLIIVERDRNSPTGKRAWQELMSRVPGFDVATMQDSMNNLFLVEQRVRLETSQQMKDALRAQGQGNENLSTIVIDNYKVDKERIKSVLSDILKNEPNKTMQIENALKLFEKMNEFLDEGTYMNRFAEKIRDNGKPEKFFPFALAAEELDLSFASFRSAGPTVLKRALGDLGKVETDIVGPIQHGWLEKLGEIALNGKHDFSEIVGMLAKIRSAIEQIHGESAAYEVVHHLAYTTIAYFRKDALAKNIFTKAFTTGEPHSLAAEFAGGSWKGVWEWEVSDIDSFCFELDRHQILPKNPTSLMHAEMNKESNQTVEIKKLFGLIPFGKKVKFAKPSGEWDYSIDKLRQDAGATGGDITVELLSKYLPLALAAMVYTMMMKAMKEQSDKK